MTSTGTRNPAPTRGASPERSTRRRIVRWFAVVIVAAFSVWLWLSAPAVVYGSSYNVSSEDHDLLSIRSYTGPDMTVIPAQEDGATTVMISLRNDGRFPVTLLEVWPDDDQPVCRWRPTERRVRTDLPGMYVDEGPAAPLPGAPIAPGDEVAVHLEGSMTDPGRCQHDALTTVATIPVTVRVLGRTSRIEVELAPRLGWTDRLESYDDDLTEIFSPAG